MGGNMHSYIKVCRVYKQPIIKSVTFHCYVCSKENGNV